LSRRTITIGVPIAVIAAIAVGIYWYRIPTVVVVSPSTGPAVQAVYATGVVEPVYWAKVTPLMRGRIAEICACEGKTVQKGERLARLDDREERARLAELEARAEFLAAELARYRQLQERRVVSSQAYERAVSEYGQNRAAIAAAKERLRQLDLRAPLDGVVLRKDGEVGEVAEPGDVLFWVGQPKPLWIVAEVDEEDIPQVVEGQSVLIRADAYPSRVLGGTVSQITPKGDPINKNYRVRIALPDDTPLHIGMTTEINVVVRRVDSALLVPAETVTNGSVWIVRAGTVTKQPVETGIRGDGKIQITKGLSVEDRVVVAPPESLAEGGRVRVRNAPAPGR
jgi:RND family efflux transporter MFP subunit